MAKQKKKIVEDAPHVQERKRQNRALMEAAKGRYRIEVAEVIFLRPVSIRREDGRVIVSVRS